MAISIPHGTIKSRCSAPSRTPSPISIPHGTIKRTTRHPLGPLNPISIPHGTIKSQTPIDAVANKSLFQFHMVRLKGAIENKIPNKIKFQFHMVRLKVTFENTTDRLKTNFNSTWYD